MSAAERLAPADPSPADPAVARLAALPPGTFALCDGPDATPFAPPAGWTRIDIADATRNPLHALLSRHALAAAEDPENLLETFFDALAAGGRLIATEPTPSATFPRLHDPTTAGPRDLGPLDRLLEDFAFEVVSLDTNPDGTVTAVARKPPHAEIAAALAASARVKARVARTMTADIAAATELVTDAIAAGGRVLACGNGGSAADAQHFAAEFVGRFLLERPAYAAIALTPDSSIMTAVGNDYGFETVFARQVEAYGRPGDVFVGISTSGSSKNVVAAAERAQSLGLSVVALTGSKGPAGPLAALADVLLAVPSPHTPRIQEAHIAILHTICEQAEITLAATT